MIRISGRRLSRDNSSCWPSSVWPDEARTWSAHSAVRKDRSELPLEDVADRRPSVIRHPSALDSPTTAMSISRSSSASGNISGACTLSASAGRKSEGFEREAAAARRQEQPRRCEGAAA